MNIKKSIYLTFLIVYSIGIKAQLFNKLDKGINKPIISSCFDNKGNITVLYKFDDSTIKIDVWNLTSKKWNSYNQIQGVLPNSRYSSIYKNDSLYIFESQVKSYKMYYMNQNSTTTVGQFYKKNDSVISRTNLVIYKNFIVVSGDFDSIFNPLTNQQIFSSRVALYNGKNWVNSNFSSKSINEESRYNINPISIAIKDTLYISLGNGLYKYLFPNNWSKINYTKNIFGLTLLGNEVLFTGQCNDTLKSYKNGKNTERIIQNIKIYNRNQNSLITHKNIVYVRDSDGWLNKLNGNSLSKIYKFDSLDYLSYHILNTNDTHFFIGNNRPLYYKNKNYGNFAELNTDSLNTIGFDTINGFIFWDKNENGIKDIGDIDIKGFSFINNITYGNAGGPYGVDGKFTQIVPNYNNVEYQLNYYQNDTCLKQSFTGNVFTKNTKFGITKDSIYFPLVRTSLFNNDNIVVNGYSSSRTRLLDSNQFNIDILNKSCGWNWNSNSIQVSILIDKDYTITGSSPSYNSRTGNVLNYDIKNLFPNNKIQIIIKGYYSNNKYSMGQTVKHYIKITPSISEDTTDNKDSIIQKLVYSYDPNAKFSYPEGIIKDNLRKIKYTIHFQNEGNDYARRVTIIDTLNLKMPVYSFQMIGATHHYTVSIQPGTNIVTWVFDNINLKPKSQNEELSKGYLVFEANVRGDLREGDSIRNKAYIYFDYNEPIITNYAVIMKKKDLSLIKNETISNTLTLFPNPSSSLITLKNNFSSNINCSIFDMKGSKISELNLFSNNETILDVSQWAKGIYLLYASNGESIKFIIE